MKGKGEVDFSRTGELNTIIGKGTVINGDMKVQSSLRVDGLVKGNVSATETVVVGKEGEVRGKIEAKHVMLAGKIKGHIVATGKVYFEAKASVIGDVKAARLVVDEGAVFDGKCVMQDGSAAPVDQDEKKEN